MSDPKTENREIVTDMTTLIPSLRAYARSLLPGSAEADDLVQETLLKGIANIDKFEPGTNLRRWLFTIMRNTFLTNVHKRKRESPGLADCASAVPVSYPVHDAHIAGQSLMRVIEQLPMQYREIIALVYLTGESYEDTARILNCPIGTIKSRVSRARHLIMAHLQAESVGDLILRQG